MKIIQTQKLKKLKKLKNREAADLDQSSNEMIKIFGTQNS